MEFNRHDWFIKPKEKKIADEAYIKNHSRTFTPKKFVKNDLFCIQVEKIQLN